MTSSPRLATRGLLGALLTPLLIAPPAAAQILDADGRPDPAFPFLYAWYTAEDGVNGPGRPPDGAAVTTWQDVSVHDRHLVRTSADPARRPTFREDVANGLPAVDFDGDDHIWGDSAGEFGTIASGKTIFAVTRVDAADGGYVFDGSSVSGRNAHFTGQIADPARWHLFAGNDPVTIGPFVGTTVFQVHSVVFDVAFNEQFINGDPVSDGTAAMAPLKGLILGSRYSVSHFLDGAIAELLVYDAVLDDTDRQAVEGYLLEKHPVTEPPALPDLVDVFTSGDLYPAYRIPALITTSTGTLLAFAEGRQSLSDHAQNDIVMRRSTDGGDTWGPVVTLHDAGGDSLNDPLAVQVRDGPHAGRILLMYESFPEGCHVTCVVPGYEGETISRNWLLRSDDDGVSWTAPVEVTQQVRRESANFAGSPGVGIQKRRAPHAGRLVMPLRQGPLGNQKVYAVYSDDGGETWTWGDLVDDSATPGGGDEVQMVELTDGTLLLNARSWSGTQHRKIARSADGGVTWSPLADEPQLIEPQVMASILRFTDPLDGFAASRLLYAGPDSQSARVNGTVHLSLDEGTTWATSRAVYPGSYAYSILTIVGCDTIGLLFERDGYARISLARFTLDWLTDGADVLGGVVPGCVCGPDLDLDGTVGFADLLSLLSNWGRCAPGAPCPADLDRDGTVGFPDLLRLLANWGECP